MVTFDAVALTHETDKSSSGHGYMDAYFRVLSGREIRTVLEIGVASGGSLRMWAELFPGAHIVGVDLAPATRAHSTKDITVIAADGTDPVAMRAVGQLFGPFDLIVDDGSHDPADILASLKILYPFLVPRGVYAIEDLDQAGAMALRLPFVDIHYECGTATLDLGYTAGPCVIFIGAGQ